MWLVLFFSANLGALVLLGLQHYTAALIVFFLPAPWYTIQVLNPSARGLGSAVTRFATTQREVWLTIDDGPHPTSTPLILDLLDAHGARATFFLIGERALAHPELVELILRRGHTVGNHTHTHPCWNFWYASARKTAVEIDRCADALRRAGAGDTRWFRPPVGIKNCALQPQLSRRGLDLVLWSARGFDGVNRADAAVLSGIAKDIKPGAIILMHEAGKTRPFRRALLEDLLVHLAAQGYRCVIPTDESLVRTA